MKKYVYNTLNIILGIECITILVLSNKETRIKLKMET